MPFTALDIIRSASRVLFDADHVRWNLPELLEHINDAVRTIATVKPNANSQTVTIPLAQGTLQELPEAYTVLARVTRNMITGHNEPGGPVGGAAIRMVQGRELMDAYFPGWQANAALFSPGVQHVIYDPANLREFWVIPGNDGTGKIEATVGVMPARMVAIGDVNAEISYAVAVPLPDKFQSPIHDFVCFRAFSKDSGVPASEARAAKHLAAFQSALGITTQSEEQIAAKGGA